MCFIAQNKEGNCHLCNGTGRHLDCRGEGCSGCKNGECNCQLDGVIFFNPDEADQVRPKKSKKKEELEDLYDQELVDFLRQSLCGGG